MTDSIDQLTQDAVLYTLPLYEMARMRAATCPRRDAGGQFAGDAPESTLRWINHFIHTRRLLGPQHRQVVTPNNDTLYSNAWLDLSQGPVLLHVPDSGERYYVLGLLDMYTNPFAYVGTRTTGNGAGTFLVHGPDWEGTAPDGARLIGAPTNAAWIIGRIMVDGEADLPATHAFQDGLKLSVADNSAPHRRLDVGMQPHETLGDPVRFAQVVNQVLRENPPPAAEQTHVARFTACGIGGDVRSSLSAEQRDRLAAAIAKVLADIGAPQPSELGGGWFLPVEVRESFGTDYLARAQVARNYIGALGIDEAMYIMADCDSDNQPLDGNHAYELYFAPDRLPEVDAFWSITMYDKADCMLVDNALNRYSIGDRTRGLRYDADGGLRLYFGAQAPAVSANWLPAPAAPFYLTLRLYMPRAAHLDRTFRYPSIKRLS